LHDILPSEAIQPGSSSDPDIPFIVFQHVSDAITRKTVAVSEFLDEAAGRLDNAAQQLFGFRDAAHTSLFGYRHPKAALPIHQQLGANGKSQRGLRAVVYLRQWPGYRSHSLRLFQKPKRAVRRLANDPSMRKFPHLKDVRADSTDPYFR
jgi:hypothetical protein